MEDKEVLNLLIKVIESNTKAMEKSADASGEMAEQVKGLRVVITGAQRKIGGEVGPIIDRQKKALRKLDEEVARARAAGDDIAS